MKSRYWFTGMLTLSVLLGACSQETNPANQEATPIEAKHHAQAVKIETKLLVKEEGGMSLDVRYPVLSGMHNKAEQTRLNDQFLNFAKNIETQTREEEKLLVEAESTAHAGGSLEVVEYMNNAQIISLNLTGYQYSGGANGTSYHVPFVYDLKEEKELMLSDLFEQGILPEETLLQKLNEAFRSSEYADLVFEPISSLNPDQKFYLTKESIVFAFDKYEYTAGAAGAPEVAVAKEFFSTLKKEYR